MTADRTSPPRGGEVGVVEDLDLEAGCDVESTGDVVDPETGLPRVMARKCPTCIYRPGNLMHLPEGRRDQMERTSVERGSWIVCHATLPAFRHPEQGICRGFYDVAGGESFGVNLARYFSIRMGVSWPQDVLMEPPAPTCHDDAETT